MALNKNVKEELKRYLVDKLKKEKEKAIILSPYILDPEEIRTVLKVFPFLQKHEIENKINTKLIAGIIIKYKSKIIDISLASQLRNFKKKMYENYR